MTSEDIVIRAQAASRLLGDQTVMAALNEIEGECRDAWAASNPTDKDGREEAYRMQRCVGLLKQKLEAWRGAGQIEQHKARTGY